MAEHFISGFPDPPCPRALHSRMTDKFVRRFNAAAANGITADPIAPVIDPFAVVAQIADEFANFFRSRAVLGLHAFKSPDHVVNFGVKKARHRVFHPFQAFF